MRTSDKIDEIAPAFVAATRDLKNPAKDATIQGSERRPAIAYLSHPGLVEAVRKALRDTGLTYIQEVLETDGGIGVTTRIVHLSGQWIETGPLVLPFSGGAQDAGSAITYARRYALAAIMGMAADEDDDGTKAQRTPGRKPRASQGSAPQGEATASAGSGWGESVEGEAAGLPLPDLPPGLHRHKYVKNPAYKPEIQGSYRFICETCGEPPE